jgi:hypothetical protein
MSTLGTWVAHEPRFLADEPTGEKLLLPTDDATERRPFEPADAAQLARIN